MRRLEELLSNQRHIVSTTSAWIENVPYNIKYAETRLETVSPISLPTAELDGDQHQCLGKKINWLFSFHKETKLSERVDLCEFFPHQAEGYTWSHSLLKVCISKKSCFQRFFQIYIPFWKIMSRQAPKLQVLRYPPADVVDSSSLCAPIFAWPAGG
ncbi:hypothetical protein AVEN_188586-1 [Araneus ventricosus]|uniref:Uncharacterized protein n=1 Tax=Araneus ventricosus TaxID=182803 RepID=A0A4Y2HR59_ARAVE|nr:hypothetical protein AVEN_188586-1 [Araneus ventricosus]